MKKQTDIDKELLLQETETIGHSPLISLNFKVLRNLQISGTYTLSQDNTKKYNQSSGLLKTETKTQTKRISLTSKYSFRSPGGISLPLFGKLKFKSEVSINFDISINNSISETSTSGGPFVMSSNKSALEMKTSISYLFSQQIKGGISGRWKDDSDEYNKRKTHTRELTIWVELRF